MSRRISTAQINSKIRSAQRKAQQQMNQEIGKAQRKAEQDYKREVAKLERVAVARHKRAVTRLETELRRLSRQSTPVRHTVLSVSNFAVVRSYQRLEQHWSGIVPGAETAHLLELARQDAASSTAALNALEENETDEVEAQDLQRTEIIEPLAQFGLGLEKMWRGGLHALTPANEEASRHFCTSAREIATMIFNNRSADKDVIAWDPNCQRTDNGTPTRRAKLKFMLARKKMAGAEIEKFLDDAIEDVIKLFDAYNPATHGGAGYYSLQQLYSLKERSEKSIKLLCALAS